MSTYTYDESLSSVLDNVRFLIGDVDLTTPILSDETIEAIIDQNGWVNGIATICAGLITRFGQEPIKYSEGGGGSYDMSGRIKAWQKLREDVLAGLIPEPGSAAAGSKFDKITAEHEVIW